MTKIETQLESLTRAIEKLVANPIAPIAPVAPIAPILPIVPQYSGDHDLIVGLVKDVATLQVTVSKLADREDLHVTIIDFNNHVGQNEKSHEDFEKRMREINTAQTRILTIGSGLIICMTVIQVWLKLTGH